MKPFGISIIGLGTISLSHLNALNHYADKCRVLLGVDLNRKSYDSITESHLIPGYSNDYLDALNRDDIDLVIVCTPPSAHEKIVCKALDKGKYVICEKPIAHTWRSANKILEKSKQYPGKLSIVYQYRDLQDFQKIRWVVGKGYLGDVKKAVVTQLSGLNLATVTAWWGKWSVAGGGLVMTRFIHDLDRLYCLFGEIDWVEATMGTDTYKALESEDRFDALFKFKNGVEAICKGRMADGAFEMSFIVEGTKGSMDSLGDVKLSNGDSAETLNKHINSSFQPYYDRANVSLKTFWRRIFRRAYSELGYICPLPECRKPMTDSHNWYIEKCVEAISEQSSLPVDAAEGMRSFEMCTAIYESALTAKRVHFPLNDNISIIDGVSLDRYNAFLKSD